ncbi:O-methyltransferase [Lysobacter sp. Root690]|uniref:O-methyltransferase n=1 Tax=Lysobacter sp. Root690 TaxID=1736588 RepID=UPI000A67D36B|nr:O-methyltransferase [Lysobacter sp. Root690]
MSGGFVPYSLRQNKAVDRAVFIELLQRLSRSTQFHIQDYAYIGFAGPHSEDFKLVHSALGLKKMISIEEDRHVFNRQQWNSPINCIDYRQCTSRSFIDGFIATSPVIAWLDFTSAADAGGHLEQAETLISKLGPFDVFKITLNANERTLDPSPSTDNQIELLQQRTAEARRRLGDYIPATIQLTDEDLDRNGYSKLLLLAVENAVKAGVAGTPGNYFQPLTSFVYADSEQQMLTHTGVILPNKIDQKLFLQETKTRQWKLSTTAWGTPRTNPIRISIPEMSVRERLHIDKSLPAKSPSQISRSLGIRLVKGAPEKTRQAIESYKLFYRHYPFFSRVIV